MKLRLGLVAALMMMVACGGSPSAPSGGSNTTGTPVSIVRQSAALTTNAYAPNPISISAGGTVTWTNNDTEAHTSTGDDGSWNSGNMAPGAPNVPRRRKLHVSLHAPSQHGWNGDRSITRAAATTGPETR